jgi:hypothetical protein
MTLKQAASDVVDYLVDSGSFLRTQISACDYGLLDTAGGCVVIVRPGLSSSHEQIGFGGVFEDTWRFRVTGYIRFDGDVIETMTRVMDMHDALKAGVVSGSGASIMTRAVSIEHNPDEMLDVGGVYFSTVTANVTAREDP